jgi:hypothetical protein
MQRMKEHTLRGTNFCDPSGIENENPIRETCQLRRIVRDQDNGYPEPPPQIFKHGKNLSLRRRVQRRGGLIRNQQ